MVTLTIRKRGMAMTETRTCVASKLGEWKRILMAAGYGIVAVH